MLTWTPVANATSYKVLRNDEGCAAAFTIAANVTGTSYTDMGLADGFPEYYTVQAHGAYAVCEGALSNCVAVMTLASTGGVTTVEGVVSCSSTITIRVRDANIGSETT